MEAIVLADVEQPLSEIVDLAAQRVAHSKLLPRANQRGVVGRLTSEPTIKIGQRFSAGRIDEQSSHDIQKIVAGCSINRPRLAKPLTAKENLLSYDPGIGTGRPQALKVFHRIAESVGMIDAKPGQAPLRNPPDHQLVSRIEHSLVFDPETDHCIDIE